jgi:hypothetical protein
MSPLNRRRLLHMTGGLALSAATPALARPVAETDWSGDIDILREAWQTLHPGLFRYATPEQITQRLDILANAWRTPASFRERFLSLTRVTASVRCGHTYPSPYNGGEPVLTRLYPDRALVPLRFVWIDGGMVVTHDDSAERRFPRGTVVTAIDDVPTSDLLTTLVALARADGSSDAKRVSLMEVRGDDRYETFDIHLPLILPLRDRARFTLSDGRTVEAGLLTLAERQANAPTAVQPTGDANPWTLDKGEDGIHRLTMPGWALYNSTFNWRRWLGGVMDDLAGDGARGLIVDLRGNEGGNDCGDVILTRLTDQDIARSRNQRYVRYRRVPETLRPHLNTWDRTFYDWGSVAQPDPERDGYYRLNRPGGVDDAVPLRPAGRRFAGKVAVLCDASNSSATFGFAETVKDRGLATLIGTPTGGNRRGINGGAFFFLKLPASEIVVDLPLIASFPDTAQPDAPVEPDLRVATSVDDIRTGRDPQMDAATRWIVAA